MYIDISNVSTLILGMVKQAKGVLEVNYVYDDALYDTLQPTTIQYDDYDKNSKTHN